MKKLIYLFAFLCIGLNLASCTPEAINGEATEQACCDGEGNIPPPPPPPGDDGVTEG